MSNARSGAAVCGPVCSVLEASVATPLAMLRSDKDASIAPNRARRACRPRVTRRAVIGPIAPHSASPNGPIPESSSEP